jgi:hypothetical protein
MNKHQATFNSYYRLCGIAITPHNQGCFFVTVICQQQANHPTPTAATAAAALLKTLAFVGDWNKYTHAAPAAPWPKPRQQHTGKPCEQSAQPTCTGSDEPSSSSCPCSAWGPPAQQETCKQGRYCSSSWLVCRFQSASIQLVSRLD